MTWLEDFYLSSNIKDDRKTVKKRIHKQKNILEYYLLTVSSMKDGMIDIIPVLELKTCPDRIKNEMVVVGVSNGYHNARELVAEMAEDIYSIHGNYDMRTYFINKVQSA